MSLVEEKNNRPQVLENDKIKDIDYKKNLGKMMRDCRSEDVYKVIEEIFFKLGFTSEDKIEISDVISDAFDMVRLNFLVNGKVYKCCFHRRYGRDCLGFSLTDHTKSQYDYKCIIDKDELENMQLLLKGYTLFNDDCMVICKRGYDGVKYVVVSDKAKRGIVQQNVSLDIKCPSELVSINKGNNNFYSPVNEKTLIAYLCGCSYPVRVDRVYNDLVNLSFNGDVSGYPLFDLEVMTVRNTGYDDRVVTDVIKLVDGKLVSFGMMHAGKLKGSKINNVGGSVTFVGNGYFDYHALVPRKGFSSLKCIRLDEDENIVDYGYVREVGKRLISMFPADAEKMFANFGKEETINDAFQMNCFNGVSPKQFMKTSVTKKDVCD